LSTTTTTTDSSDYPDASNTGVQAGVQLKTYNGNLTITTPGEVVSGLIITGGVQIEASNVTLENCIIEVPSSAPWDVGVNGGLTGVNIQNCEVVGAGTAGPMGSMGIYVQGDSQVTMNADNIHDVGQGVDVNDGQIVLENSYIHNLNGGPGTHAEDVGYFGAATSGKFSFLIQHNTLINQEDQCASIFLQNYFGAVNNVTVNDNILDGGDYTVYMDASGDGGPGTGTAVTNVSFTNNHMGAGIYGYTYFKDWTNPVYTGNVDDGATLAATITSGGTVSSGSSSGTTSGSTSGSTGSSGSSTTSGGTSSSGSSSGTTSGSTSGSTGSSSGSGTKSGGTSSSGSSSGTTSGSTSGSTGSSSGSSTSSGGTSSSGSSSGTTSGSTSGSTGSSSGSSTSSGGTSSSGSSSSGSTTGTGSTGTTTGSGSTHPVAPIVTVADHSLSVSPGGKVSLGISVSTPKAGDNVSVTISGLPKYETITDKLDGKTFSGSSVTLTAAEVNSGLTLNNSSRHGSPTATLTVTAHDSTGTPATSAAQTITVKDPPATTSSGSSTTSGGSTWHHHWWSDHHNNLVATTSAGTTTTTSGKLPSQSQAGHSNIVQSFNDHPGFANVATTLSEAGASKSNSTSGDTSTISSTSSAGAKAYALLNQMMAANFGGESHFAQSLTALSSSSTQQANLLTRPLH
jgi:hypothetical protein